jgi:hypothetical protein
MSGTKLVSSLDRVCNPPTSLEWMLYFVLNYMRTRVESFTGLVLATFCPFVYTHARHTRFHSPYEIWNSKYLTFVTKTQVYTSKNYILTNLDRQKHKYTHFWSHLLDNLNPRYISMFEFNSKLDISCARPVFLLLWYHTERREKLSCGGRSKNAFFYSFDESLQLFCPRQKTKEPALKLACDPFLHL